MKRRHIYAGPKWFELHSILKQNGVEISHTKLTESTADFLMRENLLPIIVKRAKKRGRYLF